MLKWDSNAPVAPAIHASDNEWWAWLMDDAVNQWLSEGTQCGIVPAKCDALVLQVENALQVKHTPEKQAIATLTPVPPNTTCDACGYCKGGPVPDDYGSCVQCMYGDEGDPSDPDSQLVKQSRVGYAWTIAGCVETEAGDVINKTMRAVSAVVGGIAFITAMVGAYMIATSQGNSQKVQQGKQLLIAGLASLGLALSAPYVLQNSLNVVNPDITGSGGGPAVTMTPPPQGATPTIVRSDDPTLVPTSVPTDEVTEPTESISGPRINNKGEMILYDDEVQFTHSDNGFYVVKKDGTLLPDMPQSWTTPHDYYNGSWEARYEITEHPSGRVGRLQLCVWNMPGFYPETCSKQTRHNGVGTYTMSHTPAAWWKLDGVPVDYTNPESFLIRTVLRGENGCNVTRHNVQRGCWDLWSDFEQMKFNLTIVLVPDGVDFSGWDSF